MNSDQLKGKADELKGAAEGLAGRAKEAISSAMGGKRAEAEADTEEAKAAAGEKADQVKQDIASDESDDNDLARETAGEEDPPEKT